MIKMEKWIICDFNIHVDILKRNLVILDDKESNHKIQYEIDTKRGILYRLDNY